MLLLKHECIVEPTFLRNVIIFVNKISCMIEYNIISNGNKMICYLNKHKLYFNIDIILYLKMLLYVHAYNECNHTKLFIHFLCGMLMYCSACNFCFPCKFSIAKFQIKSLLDNFERLYLILLIILHIF